MHFLFNTTVVMTRPTPSQNETKNSLPGYVEHMLETEPESLTRAGEKLLKSYEQLLLQCHAWMKEAGLSESAVNKYKSLADVADLVGIPCREFYSMCADFPEEFWRTLW